MSHDPLPTRQTLLIRLRDAGDQQAWEEFVEIYTPLVFRYCRKRELGEADVADIVQEVMRSVSLAMGNFSYDPAKGRFKAWLFTATRHAVSKHWRKQQRQPVQASGTALLKWIEEAPGDAELDEWEQDYRRRLLSWAMEKVKPEFGERIWKAFAMTALEDRSPEEVAAETGMTKNAVNIAKFRVVRRLREKANSVGDEEWERDWMNSAKRTGNP